MSKTVLVFHADRQMADTLCIALRKDGYLTYDPISTLPDAYRHIARGQIDMAILDEATDPQAVCLLSDALNLLNIDHVVINSRTFETRYVTQAPIDMPVLETFSDNAAQNKSLLSAMWNLHMGRMYTNILGLEAA